MEENFIYLKNFFDRQVIKVDREQALEDFLKTENLNSFDVICETKNISKGEYVVVNSKKTTIYIVKPSDTLESIANKMNVSADEIARKNKTSKIFVGQQLVI